MKVVLMCDQIFVESCLRPFEQSLFLLNYWVQYNKKNYTSQN